MRASLNPHSAHQAAGATSGTSGVTGALDDAPDALADVTGTLTFEPGLLTLNHAAYSAGRNKSVSTVATNKPPMIATAIGPKNT